MITKPDIKKNGGQVMLLSVLLISGAVLAATTLASFLILSQLRQASGAESSAQAIHAADSGLERALFEVFRNDWCDPSSGSGAPPIESVLDDFAEINYVKNANVKYSVTFDENCNVTSGAISGRTSRAFRMSINGICDFEGQFKGDCNAVLGN